MKNIITYLLTTLSVVLIVSSFQTPTQVSGLTVEQREILGHMKIMFLDDGTGFLAKTLRFKGINLQIVNGKGSDTAPVNSVGNILLGYVPARLELTGSHNLIIGSGHRVTSRGGIVVGKNNISRGLHSIVLGGMNNRVDGDYSSVTAGLGNIVLGDYATISGGLGNTCVGRGSAINGGQANTTNGANSAISGGSDNVTSSGNVSSICGGRNNTTNGLYSTISGGAFRFTSGPDDWVAGALFENF